MKKVLLSLLIGALSFVSTVSLHAEGVDSTLEATAETVEEVVEAPAPVAIAEVAPEVIEAADEPRGFQLLKKYFIEGGWVFMSFVLVCLILGLALIIERIITLNLATTNTTTLLGKIDEKLSAGNVSGAIEVCKSTQGPTASVLHEGLKKSGEGIEAVEKSVISYGSVQMGNLEKGLTWISLFISIAPMLGFMGTVIGMVQAFDNIAKVGDVSATAMAGDIKVALLTTLFGLITAIILQVGYNYIVAKVDGIVNSMEDASISLVDLLVSTKTIK